MSHEEEATLQHVGKALGVPQSAIAHELHFVQQLRRAREVGENPLVACAYDGRLQRGEEAYYQADAISHERGGKTRSGRLIITNKRVLFLSEGMIGIAFKKLLDVSVDSEKGAVIIIEDGRKTARQFDMEEPFVVAAVVERAAAVGIRYGEGPEAETHT